MTLPLLIGGATTSRQHTAVKIAPEYTPPTVHVLDASRVVDVVASLISPERRDAFAVRATARRRTSSARATRRAARSRCCPTRRRSANKLKYDWDEHVTATPSFVGRRFLDDVPLEEIAKYIDWTYFFSAWELKGQLPGDPAAPAVRRGGARPLRERAGAAEEDRRRQADPRAGRARLLAGGRPTATTSSLYKDEDRREILATLPDAAAAGSAAGRSAEPVAGRLHRAEGQRRARLPRHVRRHRRHRRRGAGEAVRGGPRRLQRDHGEGARRSPGGGVRHLRARARPRRLGPSGSGDDRRRRSAPREAPRHPSRRPAIPRARITARSSICSSCCRPNAGDGADRVTRR